MRLFLSLLTSLTVAGCAAEPLAPADGAISFPSAGSLQRSGGRFLVQDRPVRLGGELRFPGGDGPFPAVVLAHGCNGNRNIERAWGPTLREWGYATFVIDSFHGRGIIEVCTQGRALLPLERVPDAYGALRLLAANPKIDARRIALMGFSHGGALTMLAATAWAKDSYAPAGQPSFRAFFPFYPNCNARFPERDRVSAPVRIHTGAADDWTPAAPCADLAARLKAASQDVGIDIYPAAHHGFDQAPPREIHLPNVNNGSACFPQSPSILGPVVPTSVSGCLKKGATVAGNSVAAAAARRNLRAQLDELMK
ncbi:MAG: dienelactone hydrolase family protein [Burkholderiales bacterium]|nr:dienelactone hydrolase family protein [Burkholderiales bacterium]